MSRLIRGQKIKISNSQDFQIPKIWLEESGIDGEIEIETKPGEIIIRSVQQPRIGWEEGFSKMANNQDDQRDHIGEIANRWDNEEWEWE